MSKGLVVAAAIVDDLKAPTRVLATQRAYPEKWRGYWEFPGGKVEPREAPEAALKREIMEELGANIKVGPRLGGDYPAHGGYTMSLWTAELYPEETPKAGASHLQISWVGKETLGGLMWLPADEPLVMQVGELLKATPYW